MHSFWISVLLLFLLIACITANAIYIHKISNTLIEKIHALSFDAPIDTIKNLILFWQKHRNVIGLTVGNRELDHFSELLTQIYWSHETQNPQEFLRYRRLLGDAVEEISRAEQFNLGTLF